MKRISKTIIRSGADGTRIRCSTMDALQPLPVSLAFVFERTLDHELLHRSLVEVLRDYPHFGGSLTRESSEVFLELSDRGVSFEVVEHDELLDQMLGSFPKRKLLVPDVGFGFGRRGQLLHVRVHQFRGGGTVLATCHSHAVCDGQSLINFLKAWSNAAQGLSAEPPVHPGDRLAFTNAHCDDRQGTAGLRLLGLGEFARVLTSLLWALSRQQLVTLHFSDEELRAMRDDMQQHSALKLSQNDAMVAHLMSVLDEADPRPVPRKVTIVGNWRRRAGLSAQMFGNYVGMIHAKHEPGTEPAQYATYLRQIVIDWKPRHAGITQFIAENGGYANSWRMADVEFDAVHGTALSNFNRFGIFDLTFGMSPLSLFIPLFASTFPWFGVISEGHANQGIQLAFNMPSAVAKRLVQPEMLAKLHRYRLPDAQAEHRWSWLL